MIARFRRQPSSRNAYSPTSEAVEKDHTSPKESQTPRSPRSPFISQNTGFVRSSSTPKGSRSRIDSTSRPPKSPSRTNFTKNEKPETENIKKNQDCRKNSGKSHQESPGRLKEIGGKTLRLRSRRPPNHYNIPNNTAPNKSQQVMNVFNPRDYGEKYDDNLLGKRDFNSNDPSTPQQPINRMKGAKKRRWTDREDLL